MKSVDMSQIGGNFSQTDNMAETTEDYDDIDHVGSSNIDVNTRGQVKSRNTNTTPFHNKTNSIFSSTQLSSNTPRI
jgi:hypothetical protein